MSSGVDDEARLIERSRGGDAGAFTRLVAVHQGRVRAYIAGSIRRADVVDDLAQEVFLNAFRSLDSFKGEAPFGVWLLGIARLRTLMHLRGEVRRLSREAGTLDAVLAPFRVELMEREANDLAAREREITALQRCLERLPADGAELITERYFKARAVSDIARDLGKREGAIRMTLLRLRQALRACVRDRMTRESA